jgi:hypothetical protein
VPRLGALNINDIDGIKEWVVDTRTDLLDVLITLRSELPGEEEEEGGERCTW